MTAINDNTTKQAGPGVHGKSAAAGVWGESTTWHGVVGLSSSPTGGAGVMGGAVGPGVIGTSETWHGTYGESKSTTGGAGAWGEHKAGGTGVQGNSTSGRGVAGSSNTRQGVYGHSASQAGVVGESDNFDGVFGISHNLAHAGVSGHNPGGLAGFFDGNVSVSGSITVSGDILLSGAADCAEQFELTGSVGDPGTVMVFDDSERLSACTEPYDRRVAGVISGANRYRPGLILNGGASGANRRRLHSSAVFTARWMPPMAQSKPAICSPPPTRGHAMRNADPARAFGSVIGKALNRLEEGQGEIAVLVALQ